MSYRDIEPEGLSEVTSLPGVTIIDQRDGLTRSLGELPGAVPPSDKLIAGLVRRRRENPPVLVYCYHGNQSRDLCRFLGQLGLQQVFNLAGGWQALQSWQTQQA